MDEAGARTANFGTLADGTRVPAVELANGKGMTVRVIALGAAIQSLHVPDRDGRSADVVLGFNSPAEYLAHTEYFGATVGRYANRIARGEFELDGRRYTLDTNDGPNHLHGGRRGFDKALWRVASVTSGETPRVTLAHVDPDGAGGYPGELHVTATYTLNARNELIVDYRATTDKATIVNITNHTYFNLAGEGAGRDAMEHRLTLAAEEYTPVDETSIPTGERRSVAGSPFDFRQPRAIGERIRDGRDRQLHIGRGYDHNFIVSGTPHTLRRAAVLEEPASGRVLEVDATAAGLQFYSGNFLDGSIAGKSGRLYRQGDGLCLEPQLYPDSPNRPQFPSARLLPTQEFVSAMTFRFSTGGR